jgi:hypothetical protein
MVFPLALLLLLTLPAAPQSAFEYWPGASYDPRIPTIRKVLGHDPGERITGSAELVRYLEALAAASGRVKLFDYAKSWEGRRLVYAVVGSEANMKRLPEIRAASLRISDPRKTSEAEARRLMANLPVAVWLGYGVHGNEISSPDAALLTAYHLAASTKDPMVDKILASTIVLIDPTQNPDGRDRFVNYFEQTRGLEPDASPLSAEHNEPWPGGRTNHYLFDLNRDWFALTQPETRGRVKALLEWKPAVFVDLHEMGSDSTYYFAPEADPYNPHLAKDQKESLQLFGKNNARWFDRFGFDYFTREVYDAFYPGYGASWPSYFGSVAMTYEQASVRGLVINRSDGAAMRFRDTVRHHFVASLSTAETAAQNRERLLGDFYRYAVTAVEEGSRESVRAYILPRAPGAAQGAADKLALVLAEQGVEVRRALSAFRVGGREYAAGSYSVSLAQPAKRLIRTLLDPVTPMDEKFLKEQERRRKRKLANEIYDITAWSLPLLYNVEAVASSTDPGAAGFEAVNASAPKAGTVTGGKASVAYLVPWGTPSAGRFLAAAHREGIRMFGADKGFTIQGTAFPAGTLIVKAKDNPAGLEERVERLASATGAAVHATNTGWVEEGVNFGSRYVFYLRKPSVAIAWDTGVSAGSAGATKFVIERQFGYPVTSIRLSQLANADLSRFHVLILPDGAYTSAAAAAPRLKDWVSAGGTLIGVSGAVSYLAQPKVELLSVARESAAKPESGKEDDKDKKDKEKEAAKDGEVPGKLLATGADYEKAIAADREDPESVPGVLARAVVDTEHWLGAGVSESVHAMVSGRAIFTPIKLDKGANVAVFAGPDKVLASGYLWKENRKQLAHKPLVVVEPLGRGLVIGFTADPNYRAYLDGLNVLFLNAVFRGPAHARPGATEE